MTTSTAPGRPQRRIAVEWVYIRYRTLMLLAGLALLLVAGGIWLWGNRGGVTREQAERALAQAEQEVGRVAQVVPLAEGLGEARQQLEMARESLGRNQFPVSLKHSEEAQDIARGLVSDQPKTPSSGARLVRVEGDVRIKRTGQFLWEPATERDELKTGDQIRTGPEGSVQLVYFDDTVVTLSPGTLIEVRGLFRDQTRRTQRVSEHMAWGQLSAQTQEVSGFESIHEVTTQDASLEARKATEFRVRQDQGSSRAEVETTRGSVKLAAGDQKIEIGEAVRVSLDGARVVERTKLLESPRLAAPPDQKTFLASANEPVELSWTAVELASGYRLQVSDRPTFSGAPDPDRKLAGTSFLLKKPGSGTFYWRVVALDKAGREGQWSDVRKFRVSDAAFRDPDDHTPPALKITEIMVVGTNAIITGNAEPGALLWIDGERVELDESGRFHWLVKLHNEGENKIQFVAQDAAGNETRRVGTAFVDAPL